MTAFEGTTRGRTARVCGQMAATTVASTLGTTIGPPADSACTVERRGRGLGPERRDLLLGVQRDPDGGRDLREMREDVLEIAVAGVADDPDVHEWVSDSSAASARTRAAIPAPVRPTSASCCARGACS